MSLKRPKLLLILLLLLAVGCDRDPKVLRKKFVEKGNDYYHREKYREASIMYRRALQQDLRYAEAWYRLGLVNLKLGMLGEAHKDFGRAIELEPGNQEAAIVQGDLLADAYRAAPQGNEGLKAEAAEIVKGLLKRDPNSFDGHRLEGTFAAVDRDYPKAIEELKKADALKPGHPEITYILMQSLIASGDTDAAERYGLHQIGVKKDAGAIYDKLEEIYLRSNRMDRAEQILQQKVANIPDGINLVELARFYFIVKRPQDVTATLNRLTGDPKKYPLGHLQAGDYYASARDFSNAVEQYRQGEKTDSRNKRIYLKREAAALSDDGKSSEAITLAAKLLKDDPNDAEAAAIHASLMLQVGPNRDQIKGVIAELQPLVNKNPGRPLLHYSLARAYRLQGDSTGLEQSRLQLEETLKLDPGNLAARLDLARLYLDRNEGAKAIEAASEVLRLNPGNMAGMLIDGFGFLRIGEPDKAQTEFLAILKTYPGSNDAHYGLALCSIQQKRFDAAAKDFQALIAAKDPRGTDGMVNLRLAEHKYDEALKLVEDDAARHPGPAAAERIAIILFQSERWKEAATAYEKVISQDPKRADIWILLGESREKSGNIGGAIEAYLNARQLAPANTNAAMLLGRLYDIQNRPAEALKIYQEVLKLQPNDAYALNNLAFHKAEDGTDLNEALIFAQRAQQQKPDEIDFQDTAALIYLKKNLTDESLRILQNVVARQPERSLYRLHLAMAYYQKGNTPAARRELEAAAKNNPTAQEKTKIRELLGKMG
jgi:tetratricopeptide (TPR) repeat protein